jgi:hypothetical protein
MKEERKDSSKKRIWNLDKKKGIELLQTWQFRANRIFKNNPFFLVIVYF